MLFQIISFSMELSLFEIKTLLSICEINIFLFKKLNSSNSLMRVVIVSFLYILKSLYFFSKFKVLFFSISYNLLFNMMIVSVILLNTATSLLVVKTGSILNFLVVF